MLLELFQSSSYLLLQITLTISLSFFLIYFKFPILYLHGLFTYIHPDNHPQQQNGLAIRRPSDPNSTLDDFKKRSSKSRDKFEFDETKAQIFRLKLDEAHLQSRIYFNDYRYAFVFSLLSLAFFLLYIINADLVKKDGIFLSGSLCLVTAVFGVVSLCKIFMSLARLSFEKSASKRSDKQLSVLFGVLGFLSGLFICGGVAHSVLDFDFGSIDGKGKFFLAVLMGCFAGFLYMPAAKNARAFWLGTDQLRSNLSMIYCGWIARMTLYANFLLAFFTTLLWINPLADILVNKNVNHSRGKNLEVDKLVGYVGFVRSEFVKFRIWCLLLSGIVQIIAVRPNLQMYLNEALLSWYQRLHASKVPDLDFSRAKVFLHNHYLCLVVLQFFAPPILVLLFLGLSQIDGNSFRNFQFLCGLLPCNAFVKEATLFMAWWIIFLWTIFTSASLLLYRRGILYIS